MVQLDKPSPEKNILINPFNQLTLSPLYFSSERQPAHRHPKRHLQLLPASQPIAAEKSKALPWDGSVWIKKAGQWLLWITLLLALMPHPKGLKLFKQASFQEPAFKESSASLTIHRPLLGGYVSSGYGMRWGRLHQGVDFAAQSGTPIQAVASGRVVFNAWRAGYGNLVILQHSGGLQTFYAHCGRIHVAKNTWVQSGEPIAWVGNTGHSTGPHLHFEVRLNGKPKNPMAFFENL